MTRFDYSLVSWRQFLPHGLPLSGIPRRVLCVEAAHRSGPAAGSGREVCVDGSERWLTATSEGEGEWGRK